MTEPQIYTYEEIQRMVEAVYGQDSSVWSHLQYVEGQGEYFGTIDEELSNIGVEVRTTPRGRILGYTQKVPLKNVQSTGGLSTGNSNYQAAEYGGTRSVTTSATATKTTEAGRTTTTFQQGAKSVSTGQRVATVGMNVLNTVAVVGIAGRLGKAVNDVFYDSGASWAFSDGDWDDLYWRSDGLGKFFLNVLYGVDGDNGTMYTDEQALAQTYMMLREMGAYTDGGVEIDPIQPSTYMDISGANFTVSTFAELAPTVGLTQAHILDIVNNCGIGTDILTKPAYLVAESTASNGLGLVICGSTNPLSVYTGSTTYKSGDYYYINPTISISGIPDTIYGVSNRCFQFYVRNGAYIRGSLTDPVYRNITTLNSSGSGLFLANWQIVPSVDGIENDDQATTYIDPTLIDGQDRDTVLQQLQTNYPELFDGAIYQDVPQKDGTMDRRRYIPTPMPNINNQDRPVTGANHQNNPSVNPQTNTETLLEKIIDIISNPNTPNDVPDTGEGNTPTTVIPTGSASSLWAVYNPTQAQVDAFGAWLWSSDLVDQIKKLFSDPMQAIIGIHKVFATPATGAAQNIKCGYIDSGVPAAVVTSQYTTINCGTVSLREYFGNVFDYSPFTEVSLYLPFIGIVRLDVADVMRASITVRYHVDVITGACLADVIVNRDAAGGVLYQYAGSAIVTYPISSGSYASAMAGVLSIAGGIVGTIASGGALAPALMGAAVGASHLHTDVQKSGSFSGAAGAMGGKIPYLIISRPQTAMPSSFKHLEGYPTNHYTRLGDASGYVKVRAVQVKGINATDTELDMIDTALRQGVEL